MGKLRPASAPKETRIRGVGQVSLGFNKKISQDEARRCPQCAVATCLSGCPLGIDIPGFIRLLREGDTVLALERIKKENPFPAICGRVCPAPCETACVFHADGNPIAIRALERFAADFGTSKAEKPSSTPKGKKVAVIGSGPAGMSAAYFLAKTNLDVTIFEAADKPGGILRYGIPEFRLPQKILDEQFAQLKTLGVEIQTNAVFGHTLTLEEIFMRGYSCVLLALGASLPRFSPIPGASLAGVYYDMEFLSRLQTVAKDDALKVAEGQSLSAPQTVIIGSGDAAFDAARLSVRMGSETQIIFNGFEEEAGVTQDIIEESKEEGIAVHAMQPLEITGDAQGFVQGVKCRSLEIVESKDGLKLEPASGEPVVLDAQTVVLCNGHRSNDFLKHYLPQLKWDQDGSLWADAQTRMTNMEKIFACGSIVTGVDSVVESIAGGKDAAHKIIQYLGKS